MANISANAKNAIVAFARTCNSREEFIRRASSEAIPNYGELNQSSIYKYARRFFKKSEEIIVKKFPKTTEESLKLYSFTPNPALVEVAKMGAVWFNITTASLVDERYFENPQLSQEIERLEATVKDQDLTIEEQAQNLSSCNSRIEELEMENENLLRQLNDLNRQIDRYKNALKPFRALIDVLMDGEVI